MNFAKHSRSKLVKEVQSEIIFEIIYKITIRKAFGV